MTTKVPELNTLVICDGAKECHNEDYAHGVPHAPITAVYNEAMEHCKGAVSECIITGKNHTCVLGKGAKNESRWSNYTTLRWRQRMNYAAEQRVRLIDVMLIVYGTVNRRVLMEVFGIEQACASRDLATYKRLYPKNMTYDTMSKSYVKSPNFKRAYKW